MPRHERKLISSMSDTVYTKTGNLNCEENKKQQRSIGISAEPQSLPIETKKDKIRHFSHSNSHTMYAAHHRSSLWFKSGVLHMRILFELFTDIAKSHPGVLPKKGGRVMYGVPFLFIILFMNLPLNVAGQQATTPEEPEADPLQ